MNLSYDQFLASLCLWREARGASLSAKTAIWFVLQNRAADPANRWPKTVHQVVVQPHQFSSFNANDPNVTTWPDERHPADWDAWKDCQTVVTTVIGADPTSGATNYHSIPPSQPLPAWADPLKITAKIGAFTFYRL